MCVWQEDNNLGPFAIIESRAEQSGASALLVPTTAAAAASREGRRGRERKSGPGGIADM